MTAMVSLLERKRDGGALTAAEIREMIAAYVKDEIPDYQMSAMAMAICCRGMNARERAALTDAMTHSGECLTWEGPTADKHSTGGVGDKLSFIIQPLAAACGVKVPSLSGRALGLTGGTIDKLESVPGYKAALSLTDFQRQVKELGLSIASQTKEITPADRKLYALRDVTGTVASLPLITASILSKKLAEGAHTLVFDVKCGSGAFMKTPEAAHDLAVALVEGAKSAGRKAAALITDMSAPLGFAVGNANEIVESLAILRGDERFTDLAELSIAFAARMVAFEKDLALADAESLCRAKLADGSALHVFEQMVTAQGGDWEAFARALEKPVFTFRLAAPRGGYISSISAEKVAEVAFMLGGGRRIATDRIDSRASVSLCVKRGERVKTGAPLAVLETSTRSELLDQAANLLTTAFSFSVEPVPSTPLILETIG